MLEANIAYMGTLLRLFSGVLDMIEKVEVELLNDNSSFIHHTEYRDKFIQGRWIEAEPYLDSANCGDK